MSQVTQEPKYMLEARKAFVGELAPMSPAEIVSSGLKPIREWCECLRAARELYPHQTAAGQQTKLKDFDKKKPGRKPGRPRWESQTRGPT